MALIDNFDSYTNGDLNGQGSWTADVLVDVQSSVAQSGTKAITRAGAGGLTTSKKTVTTISNDGATVSFYVRSTITNDAGGGSFGGVILSSTNEIARVVMSQDNNDIRLVGATTISLLSGATTNTWYQCTIEIDFTNDRVRAKIDSGSYSAYVGGTSGAFAQVDTVGMAWGGTSGSVYIDTFEYTTTQVLTLTASTGSFTLTGFGAALGRLYTLIASTASFILTGFNAVLSGVMTHWTSQSKNDSTWTSQSKNDSTWTSQSKN